MRDLVRFHEARLPYDARAVLADPGHPERRRMLEEMADKEARQYLARAYAKYQGLESSAVLKKLLGERVHSPRHVAMRTALPEGVRVGTVDKFQGQEAPVVFFSMATSSGEDVPRSLSFLFSRNRLNVAISRAQCLAVLVCSPRLLDARCQSIEEMQLVNALCRLVEYAQVDLPAR